MKGKIISYQVGRKRQGRKLLTTATVNFRFGRRIIRRSVFVASEDVFEALYVVYVRALKGAGIKFPENNYEALAFYRDSSDLHGSVANFFVAFWKK
ncbi:MAG TPA: hypothetical protein PLR18_00595 [bacterium]|nr:hypothetical protein [bacterium]